VSGCGGQSVNLQTTLTVEEQTQLRAWLTTFGITHVIQKDPDGVADAMAITLSLTGTGQSLAQSADEKDLLTWAQNVYDRARTQAVES
jgi:hypothetical protein